MTDLLSKEHTILDRPFMEFPPFGMDENGQKIRDISGVVVKANVEYLEDSAIRTAGPDAGRQAVDALCRRLNERLRDPAYHVDRAFLTNPWHSYSYEFVCYLREIGKELSGDPLFVLHTAMAKHISPHIQVLCRPFPMQQVYKMTQKLAGYFSKGIVVEVQSAREARAVVRMKFNDRAYEQFGPYRKACTDLSCQSAKGGLIVLPEQVHKLPQATVGDLSCMVAGDEWCTYDIRWAARISRGRMQWSFRRFFTGTTR